MRRLGWGGLLLAVGRLSLAAELSPEAAPKFTVVTTLKETYDSNIYLQSQTARANQAAWVTSLQPQLACAWQPNAAMRWNLSYAPECTWFAGATEEDFVAHRASLVLLGAGAAPKYDWRSSVIWIDGSAEGPVWTGPGGAPATGGVPVRDRRAAAVYRSSLTLTQEWGDWLGRATLAGYHHDFQTRQRATAGYQNYVDRSEALAGVEGGYRVASQLNFWLGCRLGLQDQAQLLSFPEEYDNTFQRLLLGLEGEWASWGKITASFGPELHRYGTKVPAAFGDRDRTALYVDAVLTLLPTRADTMQLAAKRFTQPGFGGRSAYVDFTVEASWKHRFNSTWMAGVGGRGYQTDFYAPIARNDWVLAATTFVSCTLAAHWSVEASYGYEEGITRTANASGREYQRHLLAIGVRYGFP